MNAHDDCGGFALSVNAGPDGALGAAYIKISDADVAWTKELIPSVFLVDFDDDGMIVGVEILAPIKLSAVMELAEQLENSQRESFRKFVRSSAPSGLVLAECGS